MNKAVKQILLLALLFIAPVSANAEKDDFDTFGELDPGFDDSPVRREVYHPSWFRLSFLNLKEDLEEAITFRKQGIVLYFSQKYCPYCQAMLDQNFSRYDVERYSRDRFDFVAIDIHGNKNVTDFNGREIDEKEFADQMKVNFTPTLIFIDAQGEIALRLNGYHPPYKFRAALEYVADQHYRNESYSAYLERAGPALSFEVGGLNEAEIFLSPPHNLNRSRIKGQRPLAVFFEQGDCHACDVLHTRPLQNPEILKHFESFDAVQLDIRAETLVVTPLGEKTNSKAWAKKLGLYYTPTLLFFDELGNEIIRVDSVVGFYRLQRVLDYINSGAYRRGITLQQYRREKR
jgi:thioredoxin-related protein